MSEWHSSIPPLTEAQRSEQAALFLAEYKRQVRKNGAIGFRQLVEWGVITFARDPMKAMG